ncbi:MAG TPA: DUF2809 domain-containing protein [bacterium]|nr:DUF2809 domain-containing protein [bacterium]
MAERKTKQFHRDRRWYALAALATMVLGLTSRTNLHLFPQALGKYPGDVFWALLVFLILAMVKPAWSTAALANLAFGISCADEISQLYQAPWINSIRANAFGHIVLGSSFSCLDIFAYAVGVGLAIGIDLLFSASHKAAKPMDDAAFFSHREQ